MQFLSRNQILSIFAAGLPSVSISHMHFDAYFIFAHAPGLKRCFFSLVNRWETVGVKRAERNGWQYLSVFDGLYLLV